MALPAPTNNYAPTTDYNTAVKEVAATYAPSYKQITTAQNQALADKNTNLSQLLENKNTGLSSLNQAKANAFKNIGYTANARGVLFSGYSPYQQNEYTVNTYNPGVKNVNTAYNRGVLSTNTAYSRAMQILADKLASLRQEHSNAAESLVLGTQKAQAQAAKEAAAAARATYNSSHTVRNANLEMMGWLKSVAGKDNYVSPQDFGKGFQEWVNAGYSPSTYLSYNKRFINPKNPNYQYYLPGAVGDPLKQSLADQITAALTGQ